MSHTNSSNKKSYKWPQNYKQDSSMFMNGYSTKSNFIPNSSFSYQTNVQNGYYNHNNQSKYNSYPKKINKCNFVLEFFLF